MSDEKKQPDAVITVVIVEGEHHPDCPANPNNEEKSGPSKVNSNAYRSGWDITFGPTVGKA
jgi:hypothetical protein